MRMSFTSLLLLGVMAVATDAEKILTENFPTGTSCTCSSKIREVCGSDGLTYRNICFLDCASVSVTGLKVSYAGPCRSQYSMCHCPLLWRPVCGNDGFTYGNICELVCAARFSPYLLRATKFGVCSSSTIKTTANATELPAIEATDATPKETIPPTSTDDFIPVPKPKKEEIGEELYSEEEEEEEDDVCNSYKTCNRKRCKLEPSSHICGSNGHMYRNLCQFCCARNRTPDLTVSPKENCKNAKGTKKRKKKLSSRSEVEENQDEEMA